MGAWGYRTFEDDTTCDWVWELEAAEDPAAFLQAALEPEAEGGLYDYEQSAGILGAAEAVYAVLAGAPRDDHEDLVKWTAEHRSLEVSHLIPDCLSALDAVLDEKHELAQLWSENVEEYPKWRENIENLKAALARRAV